MSAPLGQVMRRTIRGWFAALGIRGWAIIALTLLVIAAIGVARLLGGIGGDNEASRSEQLPHDGDAAAGHAVAPDSPDPSPAAVATAKAFVNEWLHQPDGESAAERQARLAPYVTDALAEQLASAGVSSITARRITGTPTAFASSPTRTIVTIPTDAGDVRLVCLRVEERWRVDGLSEAS